jgi:hypothetical protein
MTDSRCLPSREDSFGLCALAQIAWTRPDHLDRPTLQGLNEQSQKGSVHAVMRSRCPCEEERRYFGIRCRELMLCHPSHFLRRFARLRCRQTARTCYRGWKTGVRSLASAPSIAIVGPLLFSPGLAEAWHWQKQYGKFPRWRRGPPERGAP